MPEMEYKMRVDSADLRCWTDETRQSYKPKMVADSIVSTDAAVGFSGGDVLPVIPGSRFRIFDY